MVHSSCPQSPWAAQLCTQRGLWEGRRQGTWLALGGTGLPNRPEDELQGLPGRANVDKPPDKKARCSQSLGVPERAVGWPSPEPLQQSPISEVSQPAGESIANCPFKLRPRRKRCLRFANIFALKRNICQPAGISG